MNAVYSNYPIPAKTADRWIYRWWRDLYGDVHVIYQFSRAIYATNKWWIRKEVTKDERFLPAALAFRRERGLADRHLKKAGWDV